MRPAAGTGVAQAPWHEGELGVAARVQTPLIDIAETMVALAQRLSEQATLAVAELPPALPPPPTAVRAAAMLRDRHARKQFLPGALFHEPAWEILLTLYIAGEQPDPVSLKQVASAVDAPFTTTQRWVDQLVTLRLVARGDSPYDRRRVALSLTPSTQAALDAYFAALAQRH